MSNRRTAALTVVGVLVVAAALLGVNLLGRGGAPSGTGAAPAPSSTPLAEATDFDDPGNYAELTQSAPEDVAADALAARGDVAPQPGLKGGRKLAGKAEKIAKAGISYSFRITSMNLLGSQHTAPGGDARGYASGVTRTQWAAQLLASYGSSVVGLQEIQLDQLNALTQATAGTFSFYPGTTLGAAGVPQNLAWDNRVWRSTYTGQITIPFVGTTRPQPIVRLQNIASGREIYVINIHNSPNDRQSERNQALAIETAAIDQLRQDGLPVLILGDFNERDHAFCTITGQTGLLASNGGSNTAGSCRPPAAMRIDWIFASPDAAMSGHLTDQSPAVRRITDHAIITTDVTVS